MRSENELPSARSISAVSVRTPSDAVQVEYVRRLTTTAPVCEERGGGGMERGRGGRRTEAYTQMRSTLTAPHWTGCQRGEHRSPLSLSALPVSRLPCMRVSTLWVPLDVFRSRWVDSGCRVSLCGGVRRLRCHQSSELRVVDAN